MSVKILEKSGLSLSQTKPHLCAVLRALLRALLQDFSNIKDSNNNKCHDQPIKKQAEIACNGAYPN